MRLLPKSIHWCRRYPTKFNSGRDIPWSPASRVIAINKRNAVWDEQFRFAAETGYRELQLLSGRDYGVSWIDSYSLLDEAPPERIENPRALVPSHLRMGREVLRPGQHPFPTNFAVRERYLRIEPAIYLDRLVRDVILFGGRIAIRSFESRRDLAALTENVIVNCTGLGSRELFEDRTLTPYKGQLTLLAPQSEVNYATNGGFGSDEEHSAMPLHMSPRSDGIALGGTAERGEWSLEPNEEARKKVVEGHIALYSAMRPLGANSK